MKVLLLFVLALIPSVLCQAGLAANATCSPNCNFNDPSIWIDGVVPGPGDAVTILGSGTITVQVTQNVTVSDFRIGSDDKRHNSGKHIFEIMPGVTFTSNTKFFGTISSTVRVHPGASFIVANQGVTNGLFILDGYASFGGSNPSLFIDSDTVGQLPTIIYATLQMSQNSSLVTTFGVQVNANAEFYGSGSINGTFNAKGEIYPGDVKGTSSVGRLNVWGDVVFEDSTELHIDVASRTEFDQIVLSGSSAIIFQNGEVDIKLLNKYEPLAHTRFYVFNHTEQRGGFDKVSDCTVSCFFEGNPWKVIVDQEWTALIYNSAPAVFVSVFTLFFGLFVTLM